jgi:DNA-binding CsgD family transcriptional regulator
VLALLRAPASAILPRLSAALAAPAPHSWAAALVAGEVQVTEGGPRPSGAELAVLAERVPPGIPWPGEAVLGGVHQRVLAVVSVDPAASGTVLALADAPDDAEARAVVQRLWEIAVQRLKVLISLGPADPPLYLAASRAAASEHAKAIATLKDVHAATLTGVLAALRSRRLGDAAAREVAAGLASAAMTELRTAPADGAGTAGAAFTALGSRLRSLARYSGFELELAPPADADRLLSSEVADGARAVVRGCVLVMLEHTAPSRIRVGWEVQGDDLRVTVRDDGDGVLFPRALAEYRLRERLAALGGDFAMDAVPGWGTSVTARFPLAHLPAQNPEVLRGLSSRELEVLAELARGHRNRDIAAHLNLTEHTVKFHVANILAKLGVQTRGEAAAAARQVRLLAAAPPGMNWRPSKIPSRLSRAQTDAGPPSRGATGRRPLPARQPTPAARPWPALAPGRVRSAGS